MTTDREFYLHDVDLGRPLSPAAITRRIREDGDMDVLTAVLQLIRNTSMQYRNGAHDAIDSGNSDSGKLQLGGGQALEALFWDIVKHTQHAPAALSDDEDGHDG